MNNSHPEISAARRPGIKMHTPALRTLGPVPDLEQHLPSDWWRTLFNSLYLKTDGDVIENLENTRAEVDVVVKAAYLEPNDRILDLCCGQGRHSLELARRGFRNVTGVDRSRYLIRLARKRARLEKLNLAFHEGDARRFRLKDQLFHCVMLLGNSFGYFEQRNEDEALLNNVKRLLISNGTLVLDVVDGDWIRQNFEKRSWEWIDQNHFVCRERALSKTGDRIVAREVIVHAERGVIADQFYAERLYNKDEIMSLLEKLGFQNARVHGTMQAGSQRNQDLGMMAHRLLVTAFAPQRPIRRKKAAPPFPDVTVIMGDPTLPDQVKLNGKFNPEDFKTIEKLSGALDELDDFKFKYLNNHKSLIRDLSTNPPAFVLNLCDEGYNNNPFMELHITALLEMLNIPYTGAGPACLGLCYDKSLIRAIAESLEVPVPMESYLGPDDTSATLPSTFPALVKPNFGDSSFGITQRAVVSDSTGLLNYIDWLKKKYGSRPILIQEFLTGPEYSVAMIGNPGLTFRVLPILQVDYSRLDPNLPPILGYESKWDPRSPYWTDIRYQEADLDDEQRNRLIDYSTALFKRTGCRDYARFDFRADVNGVIKLLEVNPNPGWCWDGKLNIMAGMEGLRYADLLKLILEVSQERLTAQIG